MTEIEAAEDPNVVTGEVSIFDQPVRSLFDTGASHSFISMTLVTRLGLPIEPLDGVFCIAMPSGETMYFKCRVGSCPIKINEKCYPADLIVLDIREFGIIFGTDWLSQYDAVIDCRRKQELSSSWDPTLMCFRGIGSR